MEKINIAVVGLGFGASFAKIYLNHPNVNITAICDTDHALMKTVARKLGIEKTYDSLENILSDGDIDAVHLVTPIPLHEKQTLAVLASGKHCACTVPMATSLEGIQKITDAARSSGKNYMMMETALYTYQFFYVRNFLESGGLGRIQFMRGSHYQDMRNWPDYWMGLPPMWYATHAVGPMVVLSGSRIARVHCFGSGEMEPWLRRQYDNPYPVESAIFAFENGLKAEATRSLFEMAREYQEGLFVYGSKASFEWGLRDSDAPFATRFADNTDSGERGGKTVTRVIELPNYADLLPEEIRKFTVNHPSPKGKGL